MPKAKHSEFDNRKMLRVDCSECTRGGNGEDPDKCSAGWEIKRGGRGMGCFIGKLRAGLTMDTGADK
jgi:hypothetical protein